VVNDALLAMLTSDRRFIDAGSGRIVEDAVFEANRLTRLPAAELARAIDGAIAHLHALGITAIHDIIDRGSIGVYGDGLRASARPLRIDAIVHCAADDFAAARESLVPLRDRGVRAIGIKIFCDGSLGGRTAALHAPTPMARAMANCWPRASAWPANSRAARRRESSAPSTPSGTARCPPCWTRSRTRAPKRGMPSAAASSTRR